MAFSFEIGKGFLHRIRRRLLLRRLPIELQVLVDHAHERSSPSPASELDVGVDDSVESDRIRQSSRHRTPTANATVKRPSMSQDREQVAFLKRRRCMFDTICVTTSLKNRRFAMLNLTLK